jgi:heme A synthase
MNSHDVKTMADGAAVVVGLGGFLGWITPIVALVGGFLTVIWMGIRIWETNTVQKLVNKNAIKQQEAA